MYLKATRIIILFLPLVWATLNYSAEKNISDVAIGENLIFILDPDAENLVKLC